MTRTFSAILIAATLATACGAQEVPHGSWRTLEGDDISARELVTTGPTLITFWALWCLPCKHEMRALKELYGVYAEQGFSIIAVNEDSPRSMSKVRSYVSANTLPFHIVSDPNGQILEQFNVSALPRAFLYDRDGNLAYTSVGYKPGDEQKLEQALRKLLD